MTARPPDCFIVRILGPNGRAVGIGTLVGKRAIVTCAHVVNAALGRDERAQAQPTAALLVEFPLLPDPPAPESWEPQAATVRLWLPPPRAGAAGDDIAGLVLAADPPPGAAAGQLAVNRPAAGHQVRVFGFPPARPEGGWVPATVQGWVVGGRLQLDSGQDAALRVQPGLSGSPSTFAPVASASPLIPARCSTNSPPAWPGCNAN